MAATWKMHVISTKYFMYRYQEHDVINLQNMRFLQSILSLGEAYTDITNADATKIMILYRHEIMNHDYIGSLACMPNEPKIQFFSETIFQMNTLSLVGHPNCLYWES